MITTLAGNGTAGYADGVGAAAKFNKPRGVAVDSAGNVYVAERDGDGTNGARIRKITSDGTVTTFASGFSGLYGIAVASDGTVYVADGAANNIRKVTSGGVVTTLAGGGNLAYKDGTGAEAYFKEPWGVAVDGSGNVWVGDKGNLRVRKVSIGGVVTTVAGDGYPSFTDGSATEASFAGPKGAALDAQGNVYVADMFGIRKVTPTGQVTTIAGQAGYGTSDGTGPDARFMDVRAIAADGAGAFIVCEGGQDGGGRIRKITTAGVVTTLAGDGTAGFADGAAATAKFSGPQGVAVDASGNVYVADTNNNRIRKFRPSP